MAQENVLIAFTKWLFKWALIWIFGLSALTAMLVGGIYAWDWWSQDRHAAAIEPVVYSEFSGDQIAKPSFYTKCPAGFPTFVGFTNRSTRTVERVSIMVSATKRDHSTDLIKDGLVSMDRVVRPGGQYGSCFKFFDNMFDDIGLDFKGKVWSARFAP